MLTIYDHISIQQQNLPKARLPSDCLPLFGTNYRGRRRPHPHFQLQTPYYCFIQFFKNYPSTQDFDKYGTTLVLCTLYKV